MENPRVRSKLSGLELARYFWDNSHPPAAKFTEDDVPDLGGKVAIVTGGAVGIGRATVRILLEHNAKVYIATRNETKSLTAIQELEKSTGKTAFFLKLDLSDRKQTKEAAVEFAKKESALHILINNAGVMEPEKGSKTKDGIEMQWGTNVVGHYIFTEGLIPVLRETAKHSPRDTVRIVTTASTSHAFAPEVGVDLENLSSTEGQTLYGQSKLGNIIMAEYWARTLAPDNILSFSANPGHIATELQRNWNPVMRHVVNSLLHSPSMGAITQIYVATSPEITSSLSGSYFIPWARLHYPRHPAAYDEELKAKVIAMIQEQAFD